MNIKITYNWLLEHLETNADPYEIQKYLSLCGPSVEKIDKAGDDYVLDIEITSNRVDCASVMGIARECQAILPQFGKKAIIKPVHLPMLNSFNEQNTLPLSIEDPENLINRALGIVLDSLMIGSSPEYIQKRLESCDIRSLNNLIDVTNYIMLEIGHPVHVFDYDRIKTGKLIFRKARKGEKIITLDKKEYVLDEHDVIIDDGTGRIIDLPGIMGTENSVVTERTQRVLLFIENNHAKNIRRTSMKYGIRTEAATINEKHPDSALAETAFIQGIVMLKNLAKGKEASSVIDLNHHKTELKTISVDNRHIASLMGIDIKPEESASILERLEFKVVQKGDALSITVPSFRSKDIAIEEDIIEEVARIYGYHNLPSYIQITGFIEQPPDIAKSQTTELKTKYFLKHQGFNDVFNYSMISAHDIRNFKLKIEDHLKIANPISNEIEYMRTSLIPSLLENIVTNQGRRDQFHFFEIASVYLGRVGELPEEKRVLGIKTTDGFYSLKGYVESLMLEFHINPSYAPSQDIPYLLPNVQTIINIEGVKIGALGRISPEIIQNFGIEHDVYICEIDFELFVKHAQTTPTYSAIQPFATIKLDLTFKKVPPETYSSLIEKVRKASNKLIDIEYITSYQDNITIRCYFNDHSRNLTEEEAKQELENIKKAIS